MQPSLRVLLRIMTAISAGYPVGHDVHHHLYVLFVFASATMQYLSSPMSKILRPYLSLDSYLVILRNIIVDVCDASWEPEHHALIQMFLNSFEADVFHISGSFSDPNPFPSSSWPEARVELLSQVVAIVAKRNPHRIDTSFYHGRMLREMSNGRT